MNNRIVRLTLIASATACLAASAMAASQFKVHVQPLFQGKMSDYEVIPLRVDIQNNGADAVGSLVVTSAESHTSYPIDLPRGADKELIVYPAPSYNQVHLDLDTNRGHFETDSPVDNDGADGQRVLMISSDGPGELGFLRLTSSGGGNAGPGAADQQQSQLWDVYSKPGESPARLVGYEGIDAIILGPGAERLTDEEIGAIKEWTLAGHSLLFIGGASAPILSDSRWAGVLPAHDFHPVQMANSRLLQELGGEPAPEVTISTGIPNPGVAAKTEHNLLVYAEQPFGLGRVVYASFNPFDSPLNKWGGRRVAVTRLVRATQNILGDAFIRGYAAAERVPFGGAVNPSGPTTGFSSSGTSDSDPFNTKLPPTGRIFYILAAYFIAVIPLNFLLLKKFKRGELAWVTAPVLSFGFAAVLFTTAASLYSAKMSTVSSGLLLAQDSGGNGIFMGMTQMFVPRAGSYDLKLQGVDSITQTGRFVTDVRGQNSDIDAVDRGQITVPDMGANNLSFRKLAYHQLVPADKLFRVRLKSGIGSRIECQVANTGPYVLDNAELSFGSESHAIGVLKPGETRTVSVDYKDIKAMHDIPETDVRTFTDRAPRAALTGTLSGFRPGPQLGDELGGKSVLHLVMFSSWEGANR